MEHYEHDVFISYTGTNADHAATLHADLTALGVDTWFDQVDMPEGHDGAPATIRRVLRQAMRASRTLAIFVSPRSMASGWVRFELDAAVDLEARRPERRIVALLVDRGSRRDIPFVYDDRFVYDLTGAFEPRYRMNREEVFRDLRVARRRGRLEDTPPTER